MKLHYIYLSILYAQSLCGGPSHAELSANTQRIFVLDLLDQYLREVIPFVNKADISHPSLKQIPLSTGQLDQKSKIQQKKTDYELHKSGYDNIKKNLNQWCISHYSSNNSPCHSYTAQMLSRTLLKAHSSPPLHPTLPTPPNTLTPRSMAFVFNPLTLYSLLVHSSYAQTEMNTNPLIYQYNCVHLLNSLSYFASLNLYSSEEIIPLSSCEEFGKVDKSSLPLTPSLDPSTLTSPESNERSFLVDTLLSSRANAALMMDMLLANFTMENLRLFSLGEIVSMRLQAFALSFTPFNKKGNTESDLEKERKGLMNMDAHAFHTALNAFTPAIKEFEEGLTAMFTPPIEAGTTAVDKEKGNAKTELAEEFVQTTRRLLHSPSDKIVVEGELKEESESQREESDANSSHQVKLEETEVKVEEGNPPISKEAAFGYDNSYFNPFVLDDWFSKGNDSLAGEEERNGGGDMLAEESLTKQELKEEGPSNYIREDQIPQSTFSNRLQGFQRSDGSNQPVGIKENNHPLFSAERNPANILLSHKESAPSENNPNWNINWPLRNRLRSAALSSKQPSSLIDPSHFKFTEALSRSINELEKLLEHHMAEYHSRSLVTDSSNFSVCPLKVMEKFRNHEALFLLARREYERLTGETLQSHDLHSTPSNPIFSSVSYSLFPMPHSSRPSNRSPTFHQSSDSLFPQPILPRPVSNLPSPTTTPFNWETAAKRLLIIQQNFINLQIKITEKCMKNTEQLLQSAKQDTEAAAPNKAELRPPVNKDLVKQAFDLQAGLRNLGKHSLPLATDLRVDENYYRKDLDQILSHERDADFLKRLEQRESLFKNALEYLNEIEDHEETTLLAKRGEEDSLIISRIDNSAFDHIMDREMNKENIHKYRILGENLSETRQRVSELQNTTIEDVANTITNKIKALRTRTNASKSISWNEINKRRKGQEGNPIAISETQKNKRRYISSWSGNHQPGRRVVNEAYEEEINNVLMELNAENPYHLNSLKENANGEARNKSQSSKRMADVSFDENDLMDQEDDFTSQDDDVISQEEELTPQKNTMGHRDEYLLEKGSARPLPRKDNRTLASKIRKIQDISNMHDNSK